MDSCAIVTINWSVSIYNSAIGLEGLLYRVDFNETTVELA